jgi:FkbM family methyltransferase
MRAALLYNARLLVERLAEFSLEKRRTRRLQSTPAKELRGPLIESLELLELLPRRPQVIYDVGANTGRWTLLAKSVYPQAEVFAFEPLDDHCREFLRITSNLQGVTLHQVALGSVPGQFDMQIPNKSDAASLLPMTLSCQDIFNLKFERSVTVAVERLDDYARARQLPPPDLIKMDVQGFECEVLNGASNTVKNAMAVITEASFREVYKGQCRFDQLVSLLAQGGLFAHAFGLGTPVGKPLMQCDALFLRI